MSEEEKEAIKFLKKCIKIHDGIHDKNLLNLIDKQHKEINRLQEENKTLKEQIHYEEAKSSNKDILRLWRRK